MAVYATLFGIGKIIFGELALGLGLLAVAGGAFVWIAKALKAQDLVADAQLENAAG